MKVACFKPIGMALIALAASAVVSGVDAFAESLTAGAKELMTARVLMSTYGRPRLPPLPPSKSQILVDALLERELAAAGLAFVEQMARAIAGSKPGSTRAGSGASGGALEARAQAVGKQLQVSLLDFLAYKETRGFKRFRQNFPVPYYSVADAKEALTAVNAAASAFARSSLLARTFSHPPNTPTGILHTDNPAGLFERYFSGLQRQASAIGASSTIPEATGFSVAGNALVKRVRVALHVVDVLDQLRLGVRGASVARDIFALMDALGFDAPSGTAPATPVEDEERKMRELLTLIYLARIDLLGPKEAATKTLPRFYEFVPHDLLDLTCVDILHQKIRP